MIYSNIVPQNKVRSVQKETLNIIAEALERSFGPKGSSTAIVKNMDSKGTNISIEHTKDGHTIVKNIVFMNPIERSVQDLLTDLTRYVVKEVGDGTTSAIILAKEVFNCLCDNNTIIDNNPSDAIAHISDIIDEISKRIETKKKECTVEDIYNIALISTNNNKEVASIIKSIYEKYGMNVYIDVGISTETDNIVREYDGMTLDTGYTDICFINNKETNTSYIRNPKIYCFQDPIDTPEMTTLVKKIIDTNIIRAYAPGSVYEPVPTVIFCKAISSDTASYFQNVVSLMNTYDDIPLLIVSDIHQEYLYEDIVKMTGAKFIKKYLNSEMQELDQKNGLAPTLETICDFCGHADLVQADEVKTKIIRPAKMFNEDGTYSDEYNAMLSYLETQIDKCKKEDLGIEAISRAKRRYNCFRGEMVDYLIGGVTLSDRNNLKASVEDAVLNCRSAAVNGVGYGANFMALSTLNELSNEAKYSGDVIVKILNNAYINLFKNLYSLSYDKKELDTILDDSLSRGCPLNIRTNQYDKLVLSSIKSDIVILDTIKRILSLMFTTNQYLTQTPMHNQYVDREE